jgi:hypothetical protein
MHSDILTHLLLISQYKDLYTIVQNLHIVSCQCNGSEVLVNIMK